MLLQLVLLGQQFRAPLVGREDGDEGGPLVGLDLLLAVEDVDVGRDLEGAVADVAEERRLSVAVRAHQAVPPALRYEQARVAEQVLALGRYAVKLIPLPIFNNVENRKCNTSLRNCCVPELVDLDVDGGLHLREGAARLERLRHREVGAELGVALAALLRDPLHLGLQLGLLLQLLLLLVAQRNLH